jgi:hypothetical protein
MRNDLKPRCQENVHKTQPSDMPIDGSRKKILIFLKVFLKRKNKYGCKNTHISDN